MLTNRQLLILQLTVNDFIESAQPVGSRQLSKKPEAPFSPATIRNDMADLEELGYLEKPHTSSGRVPSEKGYRFYVDHLIQPEKLNIEDSQQLRSLFQNRVTATEELIRNSAKILSDLTNYTSILLGPDMKSHSVKRFSIIPLDQTKAVAIIVTDNGHVENRLFDVPEGLTASDIEKMVNILNERLVGTPLMHIQSKLATEARVVLEQHVHRAGEVFTSLQSALTIMPEERIYFGGKMNMLKQPEFHNLEKLEMIMEWMERGHALTFLHKDAEGIQVRIGSENKHDAMEDCSVITANYTAGEKTSGTIAIVGPKRMDYSRVITLLDILSHNLSTALSNDKVGGGSDRRNE